MTLHIPLEPQPTPTPARFKEWAKGSGRFIPESNSGKVGIFTPREYTPPFGNVGDGFYGGYCHDGEIIKSVTIERVPEGDRDSFGFICEWEWVVTFEGDKEE